MGHIATAACPSREAVSLQKHSQGIGMLSSWGLRSRLALLAAMALLPVLGLLAWMASGTQAEAVRQAQARLQSQTLLLAANQQPLVEAARQLLGDLAASPFIHPGQGAGCADHLRSLQARQPAYAELGVVAPDGMLLCHSQAAEAGTRAGHAELVADALASRQFVIGHHGSGRSSGKSGLGFALPVYAAGDVLIAVVFTLVDVHAFAAVLSAAALPVDTRAVLLDRRGALLAGAGADWQPADRSCDPGLAARCAGGCRAGKRR
jgi:C4-dicarboxylate-specific signal transduction histidine kinase